MDECYDWVEVNDGTSTQRYCGYTTVATPSCSYSCSSCDYCGSTPGPVTGTTITVKLYTSPIYTASGFLATVCCTANITTHVTGGECNI